MATNLAIDPDLEYVTPSREDHIAAVEVRDSLRAAGVRVGTIDALIAQLAVGGGHTLLTTDEDIHAAAGHVGLRLWNVRPGGASGR